MIEIVCNTEDINLMKKVLEINRQEEKRLEEIQAKNKTELKPKCDYCLKELDNKKPKSFEMIKETQSFKLACRDCEKKILRAERRRKQFKDK